MPIISKVGRQYWRTRLLLLSIFLLLLAGSITMVGPFLVMLSGSTKSGVDIPDQVVIPKFLRDDHALYLKHTEGMFNESLSAMNIAYNLNLSSFKDIVEQAGTQEVVKTSQML